MIESLFPSGICSTNLASSTEYFNIKQTHEERILRLPSVSFHFASLSVLLAKTVTSVFDLTMDTNSDETKSNLETFLYALPPSQRAMATLYANMYLDEIRSNGLSNDGKKLPNGFFRDDARYAALSDVPVLKSGESMCE